MGLKEEVEHLTLILGAWENNVGTEKAHEKKGYLRWKRRVIADEREGGYCPKGVQQKRAKQIVNVTEGKVLKGGQDRIERGGRPWKPDRTIPGTCYRLIRRELVGIKEEEGLYQRKDLTWGKRDAFRHYQTPKKST